MGLAGNGAFVVHSLRHTAASRLGGLGVTLAVVQRYVGQKRIETRVGYVHLADEDLRAFRTESPKLFKG
jgi:site-specific recombinase XerD